MQPKVLNFDFRPIKAVYNFISAYLKRTAMNLSTASAYVPELQVYERELTDYTEALVRQKTQVKRRINEKVPDSLLLMEHPSVITLGRSGSVKDLRLTEKQLLAEKVQVHRISRGGMATFHGPGQLVAYPIIRLCDQDLHRYLKKLLNVVVSLLREFGIEPELKPEAPGVWVNGAKIASIGIAVEKWVTYHGVALNVNTDLNGFSWIIPCGQPNEHITSLRAVLGKPVDIKAVETSFITAFCREFKYTPVFPVPETGKPEWFKKGPCSQSLLYHMNRNLREAGLSTVCEEAQCPNLSECFSRGTATFMILGDTCTRGCRFCAVKKGLPSVPDPLEPERLAITVRKLNLSYVVVTSVTRDDLGDGGAGHFVETIKAIRKRCPAVKIEVLTPDFQGKSQAIQQIISARPDMFNHNIETVPRLYPAVRPGAQYDRSLSVLEYAANKGLATKSGMMLGLGEKAGEIEASLNDLFQAGCRHVTLGQYLAPSEKHTPVRRYLSPEEFEVWGEVAGEIGFSEVASAPLVRSSYLADQMGQAAWKGRAGR